jgi:hypothetical protein
LHIGIASACGIIDNMTDDTEEQAAARALLDRLGAERKKLEDRLEGVQKETHDAIVGILMARTLGPSEVARRVQYDRQHVARIAKKAGVPPLREATVVSRAKAAAPPRPAAARLASARRPPVPEWDRAAFPPALMRTVADLARERADSQQLRSLERTAGAHPEEDRDYAVADAAYTMGLLKDADLAAPARPEEEH